MQFKREKTKFTSPFARQIPILMYHEIGDIPKGTKYPGKYVPEPLFRQHLQILKKFGKRLVSLDDAQKCLGSEESQKVVVATFDDGYRSFADIVTPTILEFGGTAISFVVSNCVGGVNTWDINVGDVEEQLMTWDQIREVRKLGMTIGSHTKNHVHLDKIDLSLAKEEITESKLRIEKELGEPCSLFCFPYGGKNRTIMQMVKESGFSYAFATSKGGLSKTKDRFALPRVAVRCDTSPSIFLYKLLRVYAFDR